MIYRPRTVLDVMSRSPVFVPATLGAEAAVRVAERNGVKYLLVPVGEGLGTVCLRHLLGASPGERVEDCLCDPSWVGALQPNVTLDQATEIMDERAFRCMPVQVRGRLIGVVTGGDLRRAGIPARLATPQCASCHSRFHVHYRPETPDVAFCLDCLDRAGPPDDPRDELGEVD